LIKIKTMVKTPEKITLKSFINPITLAATAILLVGLILAGLAAIFLGRGQGPKLGATPVMTKIAALTQTPKNTSAAATSTPTATSIFFLPEGVIGVGAYVQVTGTDGAGLRMRAEPGLSGTINFTALDSEVFLVIDGPVDADGYSWWHLEAPYDKTRNGWSAGNFLIPIEEEDGE
jgi:hypothetical protein